MTPADPSARPVPELYTLDAQNGTLRLVPRERSAGLPQRLAVVSRMGDPDLLHCAVQRGEAAGGVFALSDRDGPLFSAVAENNLTFALGLGFFGELVANARYGVDVFENLEEPDD